MKRTIADEMLIPDQATSRRVLRMKMIRPINRMIKAKTETLGQLRTFRVEKSTNTPVSRLGSSGTLEVRSRRKAAMGNAAMVNA